MARYDLYIRRQVFVERLQLGCLAGCLATHDSTDLGCFITLIRPSFLFFFFLGLNPREHTRAILRDNPVDNPGFYTVNNEIAKS